MQAAIRRVTTTPSPTRVKADNYICRMKIGFTSLLAIVFIALKLTNHIAWSWVWVLSPFWISIILVVIITIFLKAVEKKESLRRVEELKKRLKL